MEIVQLILLVLASVMFGLAAFNVPSRRVAFGWMGLFIWSLLAVLPVITGSPGIGK
jgi:hypothetical protein